MSEGFPKVPEAQAETRDQRKHRVDHTIHLFQLECVDALWQSHHTELQSFVQAYNAQTNILSKLYNSIPPEKRGTRVMKENIRWLEHEIERIHTDHQEDWKERILERLRSFDLQYGRDIPSPEFEKAGSLTYESASQEGLEELGVDEHDAVIKIHLDGAIDPSAPLGPHAIKHSFQKVAERIATTHPEVQGVVGRSWLLDHPITRRLGFTLVEHAAVPQRGLDTWYQFLTKEGTIDPPRAESFLKTGTMPYHSKLGFIPVEKFLEMYLPKELRDHPIVLKKIRPEWKADEVALEKEFISLNTSWSTLHAEHIHQLITGHPILKRRLDALGYTHPFIDILMHEVNAGHSFEELIHNTEFQRITKAIKDFGETQKYETYTVDLSNHSLDTKETR